MRAPASPTSLGWTFALALRIAALALEIPLAEALFVIRLAHAFAPTFAPTFALAFNRAFS